MREKIIGFAKSIGIEECSIAHTDDGQTAVVCLFPYFSGFREGNLSVYTYSEDYHIIIKRKLRLISEFIKKLSPECVCEEYADIGSPIDRELAFRAGLGFYGKNSMLINDRFGSLFFIGYILCSLQLESGVPLDKHCNECGKCIKACPGNALENGFCLERCASHISQKKGELSEIEKDILRKSGLVFGCDICQQVCPHNQNTDKPMEEFTQNIKTEILKEEIENLSNREFRRVFGNRAFSWRGREVILRNLKILDK